MVSVEKFSLVVNDNTIHEIPLIHPDKKEVRIDKMPIKGIEIQEERKQILFFSQFNHVVARVIFDESGIIINCIKLGLKKNELKFEIYFL